MKLLVIVSGDYGELGAAMYFLQGLRVAQAPVLMLPTALRASAGTPAGLDLRAFAGLDDLTRALDDVRPDVVLLASGYLLASGTVLGLAEAIRLLRRLRRDGVALLTSDPFLGALPLPWEIDFRRLDERGGGRWHPAALARRALYAAVAAAMCAQLRLLGAHLRDAWHIYPVPAARLAPATRPRRLSYFNAAANADVAPARPAWLFVLSKIDFEMHSRNDVAGFAARLAQRLAEAVALDRDVLVIGPEALVKALAPHVAGEPRIASHSDTGYEGYLASLLAAEYAFFWNYYSFSVLHRVLAGRPVLFFDAGHLAHFLPVLEAEGIRICYDGWRPPLLAVGAPFDARDLAVRGEETTRQFARIATDLRACPSPQELLLTVAAAGRVSG